ARASRSLARSSWRRIRCSWSFAAFTWARATWRSGRGGRRGGPALGGVAGAARRRPRLGERGVRTARHAARLVEVGLRVLHGVLRLRLLVAEVLDVGGGEGGGG